VHGEATAPCSDQLRVAGLGHAGCVPGRVQKAANEAAWRNAHHRYQWRRTLEVFVNPVIGDLACSDVTNDHILPILQPIWPKIPGTVSRLCGRLETVLSYATVG